MKKIDFSLFALVFFITRSVFNLVKTPNLFLMISMFLLDILLLFILSKLNNKYHHLFFTIIFIILGINILHNLVDFVSLNYFSSISNLIIKISLLVTLYIIINNGFHSLKSSSEILFFIFIIVFIIVMTSSCFYINLDNLIYYITNFKINFTWTNLLPVLIVPVFYSLKDSTKDFKYIYFYFGISFFTILIETIIVNSVLGSHMINYSFYPTTRLLKQLPYFSFSNRLDYLFSIAFLFESTITLGYLLYYIKKEKKLSLFLTLLILLVF